MQIVLFEIKENVEPHWFVANISKKSTTSNIGKIL